ncbi:MAG TPA: MFS transporter [Trinickia sp.]|jgi:MFS family permease|uniref:MFS transporter n=1 Tax=Trinickia sp. TaxID=2571163 RepID=UPI002C2FA536|nr:MFS transporter [Trinickia sp.]HTI18824.1 MFS transporter [Trinickia sp.]
MSAPAAPLSTPSSAATTGRIVTVVFFTFICYLIIGLPMAVLPGFVNGTLGFSSVLAGAAISVQYAATVASRARAGHSADSRGAKRTVLAGLAACGASGVLLLASMACARWPFISLSVLTLARLVLGFGESFVGTGAILWGIGRVGAENNARVISWNGIATYGAVAMGAPAGAALAHAFGPWTLGAVTMALASLGYVLARTIAPVPIVQGERMSYASVFMRVLPNGMGLALGAAGFGVIATFIALYYASRGWHDAALALTLFGTLFVASRLLFVNSIKTYGGFRVAMVSLVVECVGLVLLWRAQVPHAALIGAGLTGFGFALVFPSLGVEAVALVPAASRGAALGAYSGFFDVSLGIMGPLAGYFAGEFGYASVFLAAALSAAVAALLAASLYLHYSRRGSAASAV